MSNETIERRATAPTTATTWQIDPAHTDVEFAVKHMMVSTVKGRFGGAIGTITLDEANPAASSVEVTIDVRTIDTRQEQRDAHLRSPDFFDVEKYPSMTFCSRSVEALGENEFRVVGDLTIRDVTREVVLEVEKSGAPVKDLWGGVRLGFTATTKIDRRDFGLTWNQALETGGVLVSNDVKITIEAQASAA